MEIDGSAASAFRTCPLLYYEQYVRGVELKPKGNEVTPLTLGSRVHELLEEYYCELAGNPRVPYPASDNPALELEAEIIMAGYKAKYPQDEGVTVDVERSFRVALPSGRNVLTGKIDRTFTLDGVLNIMDHKTQNRRSNSNHPKKWAAKDQASLYLWAARKIYGDAIDPAQSRFHVNVLVRPSEKLQEPPIFPERQALERTEEQIKIAVRDIDFIADEIERYKALFGDDVWPANHEECTEGNWGDCDFYQPHTYGWSDELLQHRYQPKQEYLHLAGVPILQ